MFRGGQVMPYHLFIAFTRALIDKVLSAFYFAFSFLYV